MSESFKITDEHAHTQRDAETHTYSTGKHAVTSSVSFEITRLIKKPNNCVTVFFGTLRNVHKITQEPVYQDELYWVYCSGLTGERGSWSSFANRQTVIRSKVQREGSSIITGQHREKKCHHLSLAC